MIDTTQFPHHLDPRLWQMNPTIWQRLPEELKTTIAAEADDKEIPTQRAVSKAFKKQTQKRFLDNFKTRRAPLTKNGLQNLLSAAEHAEFGPQIDTVILVVDCKRRNIAAYHNLYRQALASLSAIGNVSRLGIRWCPSPGGETVTPHIAGSRLVAQLDKFVYSAARAVGLGRSEMIIELPEAPLAIGSLCHTSDDYSKISQWMLRIQVGFSSFGNPSGIKITLQFYDTSPYRWVVPSVAVTYHGQGALQKMVCHGLTAYHYQTFKSVCHFFHEKIEMYHCDIDDRLFSTANPVLRSITIEDSTVYGTNLVYPPNSPSGYTGANVNRLLAHNFLFHPNLEHLRLKNIRLGTRQWINVGAHTFDVRGVAKLAVAIPKLLEGYRGWEIAFWCTDDPGIRVRMLRKWQGSGMGSGMLDNLHIPLLHYYDE
ncbi:hypothetical protein E4T38_08192 [Aureobasidium subglaciale]|nr:hypothetical protein E4T38_08192 [Aureobasidium subglaciale]KAI5215764.1 hypothetical protein E4T40_08202 [Aureobasidium subglaciale]KAI5219013.1 hypothetical protein E4T41_08117 [Aureobasidium subglaciale]KAI5256585.1 hypothetical protein E4T46_08093 [Aureobasidium subglaciale]